MAKSPVEQICDALAVRIVAEIATAQFAFGLPALQAAARKAPSIVWLDAQAQYQPIERSQTSATTRVVRQRALVIEAHLLARASVDAGWDTDLAAVWALEDALVRAIAAEYPNPKHVALESDRGEQGDVQYGANRTVRFQLTQPVAATAPTQVEVEHASFDTTGSSSTDGQLDAGET